VLLPAGALVYVFLFKMMSFMQSRLGPMETGPYGSIQLLAEVGKFLQKEDIFPEKADRWLFAAAPFIVVSSTFLVYAVMPFGPDMWFTNLDTGIFLGLGLLSVSVIGILVAGWASANKYALLGSLRAAGQLIAYELPLILAVVGVVIQAGTLNLQGHRGRAAPGRDLRVGRHRPAVRDHPVRGLRDLPHRRPGRAHPAALRHAGGGVRAHGRLHGGVLRHAVPAVLHRRVRHRRPALRRGRHPVPGWLGRALRRPRQPTS
jgi:hypothetical protein